MKILRHPAFLIVLGLVTGLGTGLAWLWHAGTVITRRIEARRIAAANTLKPGAPWGFWTIQMEDLAHELRQEKVDWKRREDALDQQQTRLGEERQELAKMRSDLDAQSRAISAHLIQVHANEVKNLRALAKTYANLPPASAVAIMRDLDDTTVVKILSLMKPDAVAPILEAMAQSTTGASLAKRAANLTEMLRVVQPTQPASS